MTDTGKGSGSARCDRCGRENSLGLRFCQDCGNRLEEPPRSSARRPCPRCGAENADPGRFCVQCGAALDPAGSPAADSARERPPIHPAGSSFDPPPYGIPRPDAAPFAEHARRPLERGDAVAEPPVQCTRCRGTNARHLTFCQFCGARLSSDAPRAAQGEVCRLVVIAQDGTPGRQYPLTEPQIDIGREEGAILLPSDPYVSPRHARILRRDGRIFVRDLSSVNGVYVRIRAAERLQHADLVLIGLEVLRFEVVSDAEKGLGPATERGTRVFGSPALPRYARLGQRTVEGATRDIFYLGRDETVVGRESGDLVFTNDPFMSRRHAAFVRDPATNVFSIQDLGSSNGTYLAIRGEHELQNGDHIRIGQHLFRLDVETGRARS